MSGSNGRRDPDTQPEGRLAIGRLPIGRKVIATRLIYQLNKSANGFIGRYKARLVDEGLSQKPGADFCKIYALLIKYTILRLV